MSLVFSPSPHLWNTRHQHPQTSVEMATNNRETARNGWIKKTRVSEEKKFSLVGSTQLWPLVTLRSMLYIFLSVDLLLTLRPEQGCLIISEVSLRESIPRLFNWGRTTMTTHCAPACSQVLPVKPQGFLGQRCWSVSGVTWPPNLEQSSRKTFLATSPVGLVTDQAH